MVQRALYNTVTLNSTDNSHFRKCIKKRIDKTNRQFACLKQANKKNKKKDTTTNYLYINYHEWVK